MAARNGKALLAGVIGDPVTHSLSPAIHEYWLKRYGINGAYVPLHLTPANFAHGVKLLTECGFVGFNVTLPHKQVAHALSETLDAAATRCGAVNTLSVQGRGALHGMNTDVFGFRKLVESLSGVSLARVLVLGAGGAARGVVCALSDMGCTSLRLANRTAAKAEALLDELRAHQVALPDAKAVPLDQAAVLAAEADCIISTLSVNGEVEPLLREVVRASQPHAWVIDISYGAKGTKLTQMAEQHRRQCCDGLTMLIWQAVPGFEQWFGVTPEVDDALIAMLRGAVV